jgi:predicted RNA polymerase sigma factor
MLPVPVAIVQQRMMAGQVPFDTPDPNESNARRARYWRCCISSSPKAMPPQCDRWIRTEVAKEPLRLGRVLAGILPRGP